ncbi:MAG: hypothetical protein LBR23_05810 [Spirochaetaceae bacterium]|nr:hypothetical protein [Spirochaetaceae bacterium]
MGGGGYGYGGTITISGGTVNATCDRYGAGIGGGADGSGGTINIAGSAVVTATGAGGGAGIGSGYSRTSGNAAGQKTGGYITIGGNAVVFAQGGNAQGPGASIGGSGWANSDQWEGDSAGVIVIKENAVVAAPQGIRSSGEGGPGPRSITISGGTVIAGGIGLGVDTVNFAESPANAVALTSAVLDSGTYADEFPVTGALLLGSAVSISFTGTVGNTATAGTVTLNAPLTIPEGATLRAPPGWTLVTNGYLVNNGTVIQSAGAAITGGVSGSVTVE